MVQTQVSSLSCINTPIDCLPEHVLSGIFVLLCRSWSAIDGGWGRIRRPRVPYVLASVSRHWRATALSTSKIWGFVDLSLRSEHLATHLARSKNQPITVNLFLGEDGNVDVQEALRILGEKQNWARIEHLSIGLGFEGPRVSGPVVEALNNAINANPTGIFQTISVHVMAFNGDMGAGLGELHLRIPQSQTLRSISLIHVALSPMLGIPSSPWLELERVELRYVDVGLQDLLFPLLDLALNLTYLSLNGSRFRHRNGTGMSTPRSRHSILLPKLDTLDLCGTGGVTGLNVTFQTLNMPNLRFLNFTANGIHRWADIDWDAICHCHRLEHLHPNGLPSEALIGLLSHIENLPNLRLFVLYSGESTSGEFARQLVGWLLETSHCPMLRNLSIFFPLDSESMGIIEELRGVRPSLKVYVELDESDFDEDNTEHEDIWEAEDEGGQVDNGPN
ncbi:hypothetical protein FRC08_004426 [Ceratobasidium sp. 394]|nr:hypothetical protein FRC08_004426 [Ceratobasidium sp. 394]